MVPFIHPTSDSSSDELGSSPSSSSHVNEVFGIPKCSVASDPPILPACPELSVQACFSGATILITGTDVLDNLLSDTIRFELEIVLL